MNKILGLKSIPAKLAPLFVDNGLSQAFLNAKMTLNQAPSPWETIEVPEGKGIQPLDVSLESRPIELSEAEEKKGRKLMDKAFVQIDIQLKNFDKNLKSILRTALIFVGLGLILVGGTILVLGFFRHSEVELIGKDGAATLLIGSGIPLLLTLYLKGLKMRTFTSRIRIRLRACMSNPSYSKAHSCFVKTTNELDTAFASVRQRIESNPNKETDIQL